MVSPDSTGRFREKICAAMSYIGASTRRTGVMSRSASTRFSKVMASMPDCVISTPLGFPVEPEV